MRNDGLRIPADLMQRDCVKPMQKCDKPFVEMGKYGECIEAADHAYIEQGNKLDFSIEFNEETDKITIFNGKRF